MAPRDLGLPQAGPHELTIEARPGTSAPAPPKVQLVLDDSPRLSSELSALLHARLRAASLVLCLGFAAFLGWRLVEIMVPAWAVDTYSWRLIPAHIAVIAMLAFAAGSVCRQCPANAHHLRLLELVVFGAPAVFLLLLQWMILIQCAGEHGVLPYLSSPWLILMFTYALFIPNTWQRAAAVIGTIGLIPVVLVAILLLWHPQCSAAANAGLTYFVEHFLMLSLAGVSAVFGVHTIGRLRREAFEARQLGQYRLRRRIGGGGMGDVFLAEHQLMKRPCAIKVIRAERAGDVTALARFEREVRATAKLSHWNNIDIYDYGRTADGTFYYVMEYLPGRSVADLVREDGPMPAARVIYLIRQVCDALQEAHGMGLIHRDIKPANIFAAARGGYHDVAKLLDFGLVKPLESPEHADLTQDGAITGSPLFMSPEQAVGDQMADVRSDIYSLGAVAYFMLTGRAPFEDQAVLKVLLRHAAEPPQPPTQVVATIPEDLEQVVLRCLAKRADDRFQTVEELAEALEQCHDARGWSPALAEAWWRDRPSSRVAGELVAI